MGRVWVGWGSMLVWVGCGWGVSEVWVGCTYSHFPFQFTCFLPPPSPLLPPPSQVVMAVVQLYYHLAPQSEQGVVTKAFIRLLKGHRSVSVCACGHACGRACIDCVK